MRIKVPGMRIKVPGTFLHPMYNEQLAYYPRLALKIERPIPRAEFATANVSDPLMPGMTNAIQSITFSEIPEPASAGLALLAIVVLLAAKPRHKRRS
jgi:hypothetical protein